VAMGRAIVREPKVFLMDEPLSNLDAKLRVQMRTEISKLHQKLRTTFIYVTHDQIEAMTLGDRIVVMKDGLVMQVDTPPNLYAYPQNLFVASFIGSPQMNLVDAMVVPGDGDYVHMDMGGAKLRMTPEKSKKIVDAGYLNKEVVVGFRPEDIYDEPEFVNKWPETTVEAKVELSELLGAEVYLYLDIVENAITARVDPRTKAKVGDIIKVAVDADYIHVFDRDTEQVITN